MHTGNVILGGLCTASFIATLSSLFNFLFDKTRRYRPSMAGYTLGMTIATTLFLLGDVILLHTPGTGFASKMTIVGLMSLVLLMGLQWLRGTRDHYDTPVYLTYRIISIVLMSAGAITYLAYMP